MVFQSGCVVCGSPLVYLDQPEEMPCSFCGKKSLESVRCTRGHYVCDYCNRMDAEGAIENYCIRSTEENPLSIAMILLNHPSVKMHGPEHHFLVPAVLLAAVANHTHETDMKERWIKTARNRAQSIKGGFCGFYGDCGAAVGTGIFVSVFTGATPLSGAEWRLTNLMTATALAEIAEFGGPRCCKRNTFLAIRSAVRFMDREMGLRLPETATTVKCTFSGRNQECLKEKCPFFQDNPV